MLMPLAQTGVAEYQPLLKKNGRPIAKQRFWLAYIPRYKWHHSANLRKIAHVESRRQMVMAKEYIFDHGFWTFMAN